LCASARIGGICTKINASTGPPGDQKCAYHSHDLADLILLDKNPLDDIKNTRKIVAVIVNGKLLNKSTLNKMLSDLSKRNTASKDEFDWKTMISKKK
jgi:hypothetical protein